MTEREIMKSIIANPEEMPRLSKADIAETIIKLQVRATKNMTPTTPSIDQMTMDI